MASKMVKIINTTIVKPAEETPDHSIWLSNLDLVSGWRVYLPVVYVYQRRGRDVPASFFSLAKLIDGLSRALVAFYPYAGTLGFNCNGRVELKCDGEGVKVVEAVCDATLDMFGEFLAGEDLRKQLVPLGTSAEPPCHVFMVQVTRFKCGGVCLGTMVHHFAVDGQAYTYFIKSWAAITRGIDPRSITLPHLDRMVLDARSPLQVEYDHKDLAPSSHDPSHLSTQLTKLSTTILRISKEQLAMLKGVKEGATTFTAVVSHAWQCICRARGLAADEITRLFIVVDIRSHLRPPLPPEFLGNAILFISVESEVRDLLSSDAAQLIAKIEASKARLDDSYLRSLIDFLEQNGGSLAGPWALQPNDVYAVSWLQLPFSKIDFGWGRPVFTGRAESPYRGRLYVTRNPNDDGEVQLMLTLEEEHMAAFKKCFLRGARL